MNRWSQACEIWLQECMKLNIIVHGAWNVVCMSATTNMATMWNLEILPDELNIFRIYP
jgi:hypothetical protein